MNHGLRGEESEADARFCAERLGAEVVEAPPPERGTEAELRDLRYALTAGPLRATGHTASDQVETILFRLASSGTTSGIRVRRDDGVVRPLLTVWREETEAYCRAEGPRVPGRLHQPGHGARPDPRRDPARAPAPAPGRRAQRPGRRSSRRGRLPRPVERALLELLASREGSKRLDLGGGRVAVREYESVWLERGPVPLEGRVRWGRWTLESTRPGLHVRGWRAGDRLAGHGRKVQDVFVDAKVPRSEREAWPLVVRGDEVVAVPGLAEARGYEGAVTGEQE